MRKYLAFLAALSCCTLLSQRIFADEPATKVSEQQKKASATESPKADSKPIPGGGREDTFYFEKDKIHFVERYDKNISLVYRIVYNRQGVKLTEDFYLDNGVHKHIGYCYGRLSELSWHYLNGRCVLERHLANGTVLKGTCYREGDNRVQEFTGVGGKLCMRRYFLKNGRLRVVAYDDKELEAYTQNWEPSKNGYDLQSVLECTPKGERRRVFVEDGKVARAEILNGDGKVLRTEKANALTEPFDATRLREPGCDMDVPSMPCCGQQNDKEKKK